MVGIMVLVLLEVLSVEFEKLVSARRERRKKINVAHASEVCEACIA